MNFLYQPQYAKEGLMAAVRAKKSPSITYFCSLIPDKFDAGTIAEAFLLAVQQNEPSIINVLCNFGGPISQDTLLQGFNLALEAKDFDTLTVINTRLQYTLGYIGIRVQQAIKDKNSARIQFYHAMNPTKPYTTENLKILLDEIMIEKNLEVAITLIKSLPEEEQNLAYFNLLREADTWKQVSIRFSNIRRITQELTLEQSHHIAELMLINNCHAHLFEFIRNIRSFMQRLASKDLLNHYPIIAEHYEIDLILSAIELASLTYPNRHVLRTILATLFNRNLPHWRGIEIICTKLLEEHIQPDIRLLLEKVMHLVTIHNKLTILLYQNTHPHIETHANILATIALELHQEVFKENPYMAPLNEAFKTACDNAYKDVGRNLSTRIILNGLIALFIPFFGALAIAIVTYYNRGKTDKVGFFATTAEEDTVIEIERAWASFGG